jgi:hypothetical protein
MSLPRRVAFLIAVVFSMPFADLSAGEPVAPAAPKVFTSDGKFLAQVRVRAAANDPALAPAVKKLRQQADKSLKAGPFAVTDKTVPSPSGDPHDYVSMAPYWWPNPNTPDGLPYVRRDGVSNPERKKFDSDRLYAMSGNVYTLSLAYYLTGHEPYAEHAARLMRVWFLDEATRMKPNLDYGQFVRGQTEGRAEGLIETTSLRSVVDAAGLLAGSPAWTARDQQGLQAWFRQFLAWMRESKIGRAEAAAKNNHGTWYDVQVATFYLFLGEDAAARQVLEEAKAKRIARQIEPDGKQPRELSRTKALGYSQFNLTALFELAALGDRVGIDLWNYRTADGRGIRPALDWLAPYATGQRAWPYQQIQKTKPDSMATLLRRAAVAYGDAKYARLLEQLKIAGGETDRGNLLFPSSPAVNPASPFPPAGPGRTPRSRS